MLSFFVYRMPLQEAIDTYSYFITEADKLNLAYITLLRYHPFLDFEYDGTSARNLLRFQMLTNTMSSPQV